MNKIAAMIGRCFKGRVYLLSAVFFFLSFPSYDFVLFKGFPLFAWISLIPVFVAVRTMDFRRLYAVSFLTSLLGAFLTWGWMGAFGGDVSGGYIIIWILLLPCIAFLISGRIIAAEFLSRRNERFRIFIYPAVWLAGDVIQSMGFLAFPWIYWGYSQYPILPLVQSSSVIGILGVSFLVIAGNTIFADFIFRNSDAFRSRKISIAALTGKVYPATFSLLLVLILSAGSVRLVRGLPAGESKYRIAMIQSCISPWDDWTRLKFVKLAEIQHLSDNALVSHPDLLIWSESATLEPVSYQYHSGRLDSFGRSLIEFVKEKRTPLVTGEIGVVEDRPRGLGYPQNNAMLVTADGQVAATYSKIHLCPFGEWFPYEKILPWVSDIALEMGGSSFVPGSERTVFKSGARTFGVVICYEGMFFRLPRYYKNAGTDFIVNITNDGWSRSFGGHMQHFAAAPFRAAENGIWFLRAGNTGFTTVIDPLGRTVSSIPILQKGFLVADIYPDRKIRTIYSHAGDLFSYCILILCALLCISGEIKRFYKKGKGSIL
jgi:apolipoprotein N-acyltransferase